MIQVGQFCYSILFLSVLSYIDAQKVSKQLKDYDIDYSYSEESFENIGFPLFDESNENRLENYQENVLVETELGKINGNSKEFKTRLGKQIFAFRGIRYAEPPTENLRFEIPKNMEDNLRPVIVYIHGGNFHQGSSQSSSAGPQYILDMDVVLVTVNYRLGALGFLSWGDEVLPGNNGLKDQVAALKFVQRHIANFGGDASRVTLMGFGSGAISAGLHLVSTMSQGLFHRAILMSGAPIGTHTYSTNQKSLAIRLTRLLNCEVRNSVELVLCLRNKTAAQISQSYFALKPLGNNQPLWKPVIENRLTTPQSEQFLTDDPVKLFQNGNFTKIPIIAGITEYELLQMAYQIVQNKSSLDTWNQNFNFELAKLLQVNVAEFRNFSREIRKFYFGDSKLDKLVVMELSKMFSDALIGFPINQFVNIVSKTCPVYYYKFGYKGLLSHYYLPDFNRPIGPVYQDDLMYLIYESTKFPILGIADPAVRTIERLNRIWSNFAHIGVPIPFKHHITDGEIWEPYNSKDENYLNIHCKLSSRRSLNSDRYSLWSTLFPLEG